MEASRSVYGPCRQGLRRITFGVHVNTGRCLREDETLEAMISKYISLKSPICIYSHLSAVLSLRDTTGPYM